MCVSASLNFVVTLIVRLSSFGLRVFYPVRHRNRGISSSVQNRYHYCDPACLIFSQVLAGRMTRWYYTIGGGLRHDC
jgi:hypothetical protein